MEKEAVYTSTMIDPRALLWDGADERKEHHSKQALWVSPEDAGTANDALRSGGATGARDGGWAESAGGQRARSSKHHDDVQLCAAEVRTVLRGRHEEASGGTAEVMMSALLAAVGRQPAPSTGGSA